jgi:hypothetical protein
MTRMLTIISGAGIMVLVLLPLLEAHRLWEAWTNDDFAMKNHIGAKVLFFALVILGVTIASPLALIASRLFARYFRG